MNNFDKKIGVILNDNVNVPDSFENAIKSAFEKKGMVNMKRKIMSKKVLVILAICLILIAGRYWSLSNS